MLKQVCFLNVYICIKLAPRTLCSVFFWRIISWEMAVFTENSFTYYSILTKLTKQISVQLFKTVASNFEFWKLDVNPDSVLGIRVKGLEIRM